MNLNSKKSIINKEAFEAFQSLRSDNESVIIIKLQAFRCYLEKLCTQICPKGLKNNFIYQWIFTHKVNKKDFESYCKANLFAAVKSLNRIISKIDQDGINQVNNRILKDFICDLKSFIQYFDKNHDYSWLLANTNIHNSNFYYNLSNNVFWTGMPGKHSQERLVLASSTPFIIRQSIEYKIKRILGIDYLLDNGKPDIRTTKKCFKAIENNKVYYRTTDFDFKIIEIIHSWTNVYIHGGYRPEPWRTETAVDYLTNLFYSGQTSVKNSYSLFAGVEVLKGDISKVLENTEKSLKNGIEDNVKIIWLNKPEVAIVKKL